MHFPFACCASFCQKLSALQSCFASPSLIHKNTYHTQHTCVYVCYTYTPEGSSLRRSPHSLFTSRVDLWVAAASFRLWGQRRGERRSQRTNGEAARSKASRMGRWQGKERGWQGCQIKKWEGYRIAFVCSIVRSHIGLLGHISGGIDELSREEWDKTETAIISACFFFCCLFLSSIFSEGIRYLLSPFFAFGSWHSSHEAK